MFKGTFNFAKLLRVIKVTIVNRALLYTFVSFLCYSFTIVFAFFFFFFSFVAFLSPFCRSEAITVRPVRENEPILVHLSNPDSPYTPLTRGGVGGWGTLGYASYKVIEFGCSLRFLLPRSREFDNGSKRKTI